MIERKTKIINVMRKPRKCPVCGERVVDIIYGTGDMTEIEFVFAYRREGMMGGDKIPRNPPIWERVCGCRWPKGWSCVKAEIVDIRES